MLAPPKLATNAHKLVSSISDNWCGLLLLRRNLFAPETFGLELLEVLQVRGNNMLNDFHRIANLFHDALCELLVELRGIRRHPGNRVCHGVAGDVFQKCMTEHSISDF